MDKNLVRRANNFRNPENLPKKYFPGIIEYKVVILSGAHDHEVWFVQARPKTLDFPVLGCYQVVRNHFSTKFDK
jgi:hypothetical protein